MEDKTEKKQNNRREDEKRNPDSKRNTPSKEREWDPSRDDKEEDISEADRLKAIKDIRKPTSYDNK